MGMIEPKKNTRLRASPPLALCWQSANSALPLRQSAPFCDLRIREAGFFSPGSHYNAQVSRWRDRHRTPQHHRWRRYWQSAHRESAPHPSESRSPCGPCLLHPPDKFSPRRLSDECKDPEAPGNSETARPLHHCCIYNRLLKKRFLPQRTGARCLEAPGAERKLFWAYRPSHWYNRIAPIKREGIGLFLSCQRILFTRRHIGLTTGGGDSHFLLASFS